MVHDIIDKSFRLLYDVGTYLGVRLLRRHQPGDSLLSHFLRKIIFISICLIYCLGLVLMTYLCIPIPENGVITIKLEAYFAFPLVWIAVLLNGLFCFIMLNRISNYLIDQYHFKNQCQNILSVVQPCKQAFLSWHRKTMCVILTGTFVISLDLILIPAAGVGLVDTPFRMERLSYWLSLPIWFCWIAVCIATTFSIAHAYCYCAFFYGHCELARVNFQAYCDKLKKETAATFKKRRMAFYHQEYYRLMTLVHHLDRVFKLPCFFQLFMATIIGCFLLFLFTKGQLSWVQFLYIIGTAIGFGFSFTFKAVPAVMLDDQVSLVD